VRYLTLGQVLLVASSECHQPPPGWSLKASGHTVEESEAVRFLGKVRIDGMADKTTVFGISVESRDTNRTLLKTVQIGQFGDKRFRVELNETFNQSPRFVLVKVESGTRRKIILGYQEPTNGVRLGDYPDIAGSVVQDTEVVYSGAVKEDRNFADRPPKVSVSLRGIQHIGVQ